MKQIFILAMLMTSLVLAKNATTSPYLEGLHYKKISPAFNTENSKQVVVYEFFSYRCPHCASFQPYMHTLTKDLPEYVKVIQVPLGFNPSWKVFAQAYYTAQAMGILKQSHQSMFDALHKQHKKLYSIEEVSEWYASEFGIGKKQFLSTANSFMINGMIKKGNNIAIKMQIPSTPKLVINGKYMPEVTALGSSDAVIELSKYLIQQEAKSMGLIE